MPPSKQACHARWQQIYSHQYEALMGDQYVLTTNGI